MRFRPFMRILLASYRSPSYIFAEHVPVKIFRISPLQCFYLRPWKIMDIDDVGESFIRYDKNEFCVNLDVKQFSPDDLNIKVENGYLIVDGKHEESSEEQGTITREFSRSYKLPSNVDETSVVSHLSAEGILSLRAPKKARGRREIPIPDME